MKKLICYVFVCVKGVHASAISDNDEEQMIQHQLLTLLTGDRQTSRYAAFQYYIKYYELGCSHRARKAIQQSDKSNKDHLLDQLYALYDQHVKEYANQNRQSQFWIIKYPSQCHVMLA